MNLSPPQLRPIELLRPSLHYKVWGGNRLAGLRHVQAKDEKGLPLGETWEISSHSLGPSSTSLGPLNIDLPYLVKLIDTSEYLSVQVHPDDSHARQLNQRGKTECWLILEAGPHAELFLGVKDGVDEKRLRVGLAQKEDISLLMNHYSVQRGDFFYVPAGTLHAIGSDITLVEVQQSSGITYRMWDWDRRPARELHIEESFAVIRYGKDQSFSCERNIFGEETRKLANHKDFKLEYCRLLGSDPVYNEIVGQSSTVCVLVLSGELEIERMNTRQSVGSYQSVLMSQCQNEKVRFLAKGGGPCSYLMIS